MLCKLSLILLSLSYSIIHKTGKRGEKIHLTKKKLSEMGEKVRQRQRTPVFHCTPVKEM